MTGSATPAPGGQVGAPRAGATTQDRAESPAGVQTLRRIKNRRKAGPTYKISMIVFTLGLLAIAVDAVLFLSGVRDMPLWLHLLTILAPLGLAIGLVGTVLEARRERD